MIDNIGIDIVDNERIKKSINNSFLEKILTEKEKNIFLQKSGQKQAEYICGRFAAKEAIIKAIHKYEKPNYTDIEILNNKDGAPVVSYNNYNIIVSISHEKKYTIAEAIVLK